MQLVISFLYFVVVVLNLCTAIRQQSHLHFFVAVVFLVCSVLSFITWRKDRKRELEIFFNVWKCPYFCEYYKKGTGCVRPVTECCTNNNRFVLRTELQNLSQKDLLKEIEKTKKAHEKEDAEEWPW